MFHLRVPKMSFSYSDWLSGLFYPRYGIRTWKVDGSNCWTGSVNNTTTSGSLTSLTIAAILKIFNSGRISMNFGMVGLDQLLKHMGSWNVIFSENLLVSRLTSLTISAILKIFIYGPKSMKFCMWTLGELSTHMGTCHMVFYDTFLFTRLTSLTVDAILNFFINEPILLKFCMFNLNRLLSHMVGFNAM